MSDWATTRAAMTADQARLALILGRSPRLHAGLWALRIYRLGRWLHQRNHKAAARFLWALNLLLTGADLGCAEVIGAGCVILDPRGVIIYGTVGPDCTVGRGSGIGGLLRGALPPPGGRGLHPHLGARCILGRHSLVLGGTVIGDDCTLGEGCTVLTDLPAGSSITARPAAWKAMRIGLHRRPRPDLAGAKTLGGVIRTDVARCVTENSGSDERVGFLRFWGHLILPAVQALVLFRLSHALHARGWRRSSVLLTRLNAAVYGVLIHPASEIGPGLFIPHTIGVRFCGRAGPLLSMFPQSAVGPETWPELGAELPADVPLLGADVGVGAQASVVGSVRVGDLVLVGVKVNLTRDIADGLTAVPQRNWSYLAKNADASAALTGMEPEAAD
ncbi:hypothetical protein [Sediminicoccus sp. KRV36]|uniref:hypothetical protein n=1 Tax=Sediminicoccus sp. KRV36 TaxID=3133721 RepID=UPI002010891E|nr:hypothetical protein [Sediminicoccus rosea]UPY36721.1 hypothetical protein LHU95_21240 [Sediminicoccus rosea]